MLTIFLAPLSSQAYKVAFLGDQGIDPASYAVLFMLKTKGVDLLVHGGDFDYEDKPKKWDQMHTVILGRDFPMIAVLGNHDLKKKDEYIRRIKSRMERSKKNQMRR